MSISTFDEAAHPRVPTGQFATKVNSAPEGALSATPRTSVFPEVPGTIVFQAWDERDNAVETGRTVIDLADIFDGCDLDDLPTSQDDYERLDTAYFWAHNLGLVESHGGPFEVYVDGSALDAYRAAREAKWAHNAVKRMPTASPAERKERFNGTMLAQLPEGGLSAALAWDEAQAVRWAQQTRTILAQQVAQGRIQPDFLDEEDREMFDGIQRADRAATVTHRDEQEIRQVIVDLYDHLATTRW